MHGTRVPHMCYTPGETATWHGTVGEHSPRTPNARMYTCQKFLHRHVNLYLSKSNLRDSAAVITYELTITTASQPQPPPPPSLRRGQCSVNTTSLFQPRSLPRLPSPRSHPCEPDHAPLTLSHRPTRRSHVASTRNRTSQVDSSSLASALSNQALPWFLIQIHSHTVHSTPNLDSSIS